MIAKVARLLLKSIQENKPRQLINKLAKYIVAYDYKDTVITRFIQMLGHIPENKLLSIINNSKLKFNVGSVEEPMTPEKEKRIREALGKYGVITISKIADRIIEPSWKLKEKLAQKYKSDAEQKEFWVKTPSGEVFKFIFKPTFHFAHRIFLRDIEDIEVKKVMWEYAIAIVSNYREATRYGEDTTITYYSSVQKAGFNLFFVTGEPTLIGKTYTIDMVSMYPVSSEPQTIEVSGYEIKYREPRERPVAPPEAPKPIVNPTPTPIIIPKPPETTVPQQIEIPIGMKPTVPELDLTDLDSLLSVENDLFEQTSAYIRARDLIFHKIEKNKIQKSYVSRKEPDIAQKTVNLKELESQLLKLYGKQRYTLYPLIRNLAARYNIRIPVISTNNRQMSIPLEQEIDVLISKLMMEAREQRRGY
jgi:hypothetical protein